MDMTELEPVVREIKAATDTRIRAVMDKVSDVETKHAELRAELRELEKHSAARPRGGASEDQPVRVSDTITNLEAGMTRIRSGASKVERFELKSFHIGRKAGTSRDWAPQGLQDPEWYPAPRRLVSVRDLLPLRPTVLGSIEYLSVARTGAAAVQVVEGFTKATIDLTPTVLTAPVVTIAVWTSVTRQALDDATQMQDAIDGELLDALRLEEDEQLLRGAGTAGNIAGLWTMATAYNRTVAGDLPRDTLRRAVTQVQLARGDASGIVISPIALEQLELDKDADGNYVLSLPVTDGNGRTTLWRVPTVVSDVMGANEFLVGDFLRAARLYDRQTAHFEVSTSHADYFVRNMAALLAEERLALTIPRPTMLVKGLFDD